MWCIYTTEYYSANKKELCHLQQGKDGRGWYYAK